MCLNQLQIQFKDKKWNIEIERIKDIVYLTHLRQEKVYQGSQEFFSFSWKLILTFSYNEKVKIKKLRIEFDKIEEIYNDNVSIEDLSGEFKDTFSLINEEFNFE